MIGDVYECETCGTEFQQQDDCHWYCSAKCWAIGNDERADVDAVEIEL